MRMYDRIAKYKSPGWKSRSCRMTTPGTGLSVRNVDTMVTGGEHEYTLAGFRRLIEEGCVDIVQPDIYRAGGPTGLKKIAALAKAHHLKLVCHGIGTPHLPLPEHQRSRTNAFAEYVDIYRNTTKTGS